MAFPAPSTPGERWCYLRFTDDGVADPVLSEEILCWYYSRGYTGMMLYQLGDITTGSAFTAAGKMVLQGFIARASARGMAVGGVGSTNTASFDRLINYNAVSAPNQKFSAYFIENEWWNFSFNSAVQQVGTGAYSFTVMKANLLARQAACIAANITIYLYDGYSHLNGYVYSDGTVVTGGDEITQLEGIVNKFGLHIYPTGQNCPGIGYALTRMGSFSTPQDVLLIASAESTTDNATGGNSPANNFSGYFFERKDSAGVFQPGYTIKNEDKWYKYIVVDTNALGYVPAQLSGTPRYFNAITDPTIQANVNIVGIMIFEYPFIHNKVMQDGPNIYVNAGASFSDTVSPVTSISGYACDDNIGTPLTYAWTIIAQPGGGSLVNATTLTPQLVWTNYGLYQLRLTASDGTVSDTSDLFITTVPGAFAANIELSNKITCNGDCDGSLTVTPTGGTAPYTYLWSNGDTTATIIDLCEGTYSVIVTDNLGAIATASYDVEAPSSVTVTATLAHPTCFGAANGSITVNGGGGNGNPYTYLWSPGGQITNTITGLANGTYSVTVTDGLGCTGVAVFQMASPAQIQDNAIISQPVCSGDQGTITIAPSGGSGAPYTQLWSDLSTGVSISKPPGNYSVVITDTKGCTQFYPYTINSVAAFVLNVVPVGAPCLGSSVEFQITVNGVENPTGYTYLWPATGATTSSIIYNQTSLGTFSFDVVVTAPTGCFQSFNFGWTVNPIPTEYPVISADGPLLACPGATVTLTVDNAAQFSTFLWSTGDTTSSITVDYEDSFFVSASLGDGCSLPSNIITLIAQPTAITLIELLPNVCSGSGTDGAIDVITSDGCPPYTWEWRNSLGTLIATTEDVTGLVNDDYTITATDSQGSTASETYTIFTSSPSVTLNATNLAPGSPASITSIVTGGTSPYTYLWNTGDTTPNLSPIYTPGNYTLIVTDDNGCTTSDSVVLGFNNFGAVGVVAQCCAAQLGFKHLKDEMRGKTCDKGPLKYLIRALKTIKCFVLVGGIKKGGVTNQDIVLLENTTGPYSTITFSVLGGYGITVIGPYADVRAAILALESSVVGYTLSHTVNPNGDIVLSVVAPLDVFEGQAFEISLQVGTTSPIVVTSGVFRGGQYIVVDQCLSDVEANKIVQNISEVCGCICSDCFQYLPDSDPIE